MNIFVLDENPTTAAQMHCDKHCVKMVVELYQQLGSALRRHGATDGQMPKTSKGTPLKGGYHNHPCTRWCGDSQSNFLWAADHAISLAEEYTYRYGKKHACSDGIYQMSEMYHLIPEDRMTPFAQAMPDEFKNKCAVTAYRDYYSIDKRNNIKVEWKKRRNKPYWWR
tara:strand:+ start:127 stop:627 length:501 start_codon:yes stop_codon:yes gene_type:complete